ncbi:MAG: NAD(P)H-dependent oxidoreductase subunit E [Anaerolineae bacterium UTCFX2]|jgi:NADH:ubiquinone oxidoreductase subunit E|nr:NAD(P)H-dependent oxidoreductase subunit E [Anaerolineae bacterium]MCZ7553846.1 NAD(P)H-dependent oxidoreductase subunit E [Anaerolineales bacterium]OQY93171.1 MAG: NAD(P)H-dependent oxidoreductase subunit E [Anaerolineae bacterium UTCFX2]
MSAHTTDNGYKEMARLAIEKHGTSPDALIPILLEVNQEYGYIPVKALTEIKKHLNAPVGDRLIQEGHLFSLASFYHMLSLKARGRHIVLFCESAPCHVTGGRAVWQALQEQLSLSAGETSPDGKWSLVTTSCLGACGVGPVVVIDEDMYGNVTPERLPEILSRYE